MIDSFAKPFQTSNGTLLQPNRFLRFAEVRPGPLRDDSIHSIHPNLKQPNFIRAYTDVSIGTTHYLSFVLV